MSDVSQDKNPQEGREDRTPPSSLDPDRASESGGSLPEHGSAHFSRQTALSPRLIRDSGLWVWLWVIGAVLLVAIIIVLVLALPSKKSVGPVQHSGSAQTLPVVL